MKLKSGIALLAVAFAMPAYAQTAVTPTTAAQLAPTAPEARPAKIPAAAFARSTGLGGMTLSADGNLIAFSSMAKGVPTVAILNADTRELVQSFDVPEKYELQGYEWAGAKRLLLTLATRFDVGGETARATRLVSYDTVTKQLTVIAKKDMGLQGDNVIFIDPAGEYVLLSMQRTVFDYPSVWRFPLDGTAAKTGKEILSPQKGVWLWLADNAGVVRMGYEPAVRNALRLWYRSKDGEPFRLLDKIEDKGLEEGNWDNVHLVAGTDVGYTLRRGDNDKVVLRTFDFASGKPGDVVFAAPGWDVDDFSLGRDGKLESVTYTDDKERIAWFDPKMKSLQARMARELAGKDATIGSRSLDGSRALVFSQNESDPGAVHLYTAGLKLEKFAPRRPDLDPALLAQPKPFTYVARDKTVITGYVTLPKGRPARNLPLIILPHGGPYWVRDTLSYDNEVQFLANRGYAVIQPNYRGSGGFGSAFDQLGEGQIGRAMQDDLDDAMDWAVSQGIADPKRVCMVGGSYGGYAALWAVTRNPERYRCAVSFAGVTNWKKQLSYSNQFFSPESKRSWSSRVAGEKKSKFDLDSVSPTEQVGRLTRPVLLVHGDDDTRVPFKQFEMMRDAAAGAGKKIDTLVLPKEGHGFSMPDSELKYLEAVDAFLAKHNPAD